MDKKYGKNILKFISVLVLGFSSLSLGYSDPDKCPKKLTHFDNLQFGRSYQEETAECWISIDNMDAYKTLIYRSYLITTEGLLMVFNSYGKGPSSSFTGARMFYFLPREVFLNEISQKKNLLSVRLNSRLNLQFETKKLNLVNQENFKVITDPKITRKNNGGVEIKKYTGVYLDTGFSLGEAPTTNPERSSFFVNPQGQKCSVLNKQIFDYKNGEMYLQGDSILKATVQRVCPEFVWVD